jgi:hypothetical protein
MGQLLPSGSAETIWACNLGGEDTKPTQVREETFCEAGRETTAN